MLTEDEKLGALLKTAGEANDLGKKIGIFAGGGVSPLQRFFGPENMGRTDKTRPEYWKTLERLRLRPMAPGHIFPKEAIYIGLLTSKTKMVDPIVTTTYDDNLNRVLTRLGAKFIQNPCLTDPWQKKQYHGYKSLESEKKGKISIWKIHGDVRYIRFSRCDQLKRLRQKFEVFCPPGGICHIANVGEHSDEPFYHHVRDPEKTTVGFEDEIRKGLEDLGANQVHAILVLGFGADLKIDKHVVSFLSKLAKKKQVIDINISDTPLNRRLRRINQNYFIKAEINKVLAFLTDRLIKLTPQDYKLLGKLSFFH